MENNGPSNERIRSWLKFLLQIFFQNCLQMPRHEDEGNLSSIRLDLLNINSQNVKLLKFTPVVLVFPCLPLFASYKT